MKRLTALLIVLIMVIGLLPVYGAEDFIGTTVYEDDFESGAYTIKTNTENTVKEIYKNGKLSWTFAKTNGKVFESFPEDVISDVSTDTNAPVNLSMAFSTDAYTLDSTNAFLNLPKKYTSGSVMVEFRLKRAAANGNLSLYVTSDEVTADGYSGDYATRFFTKTGSSSAPNGFFYSNYYNSSTYDGLVKYDSSSTRNKIKGYNYVKLVLDITNKTVDTYIMTGNESSGAYKVVSEGSPWYKNGDDEHMADGISGLYFTGASSLKIDDVKISYDSGNGAPVASGIKLEGKPVVGATLSGSYTDFEDRMGQAESGSTATWRRADDLDFVTNVEDIKTEPISAKEISTYTLTEADYGKYIQFSVTPRKDSVEFPAGDEVFIITEMPVRQPQTVPITNITSHVGGERYYHGTPIELMAEADCDNTEITKVEFYANDELIGECLQAPYRLEWNPEVNDYSVYVKAYNALGESAASQPITIMVMYDDPIKMNVIYSDNMVLQREKPIKITGKATDRERCVYITLGNNKITVPIVNGEFEGYLPAMEKGTGYTLTLESGRTGFKLEYTNVAIGDVWVCSGQSNMAYTMSSASKADKEAANYPNMRLFWVNQKSSEYEVDDVSGGPWTVCTPSNVVNFSAVGFYFGEKLMHDLDVPVGLIYSNKGGTKMSAWITRDGLLSDGNILSYSGSATKSNLYNGMIAPLTDFTICGVAWYQGESDSQSSTPFQKLNATLIQSWRDAWGQGDFPFVQVQLPNFRYSDNRPLARVRESQMSLVDLMKNVGCAVTIDVGDDTNIHPTKKKPVGQRMALQAMHIMYPEMDIVYSSPKYKSHTVEGNKVIIKLDHVGAGLMTKDGLAPSAFTICGEDKTFVEATAEITGADEITVWSDDVAAPVSVRYAWSNTPVVNLENSEGIPCCPFRLDDWKLTSTNYGPYAYVSAPAAGQSFKTGDDITIKVDAFDCDGTVTKVELFADNEKIAEFAEAPYEYTWEDVPAGTYHFTAIATDNNGVTNEIKGTSQGALMTNPITVGHVAEDKEHIIATDFEDYNSALAPDELGGMLTGSVSSAQSPYTTDNTSMKWNAKDGAPVMFEAKSINCTDNKLVVETRFNVDSFNGVLSFGFKKNGSSTVNEILTFDSDSFIKTAFPYAKAVTRYVSNKWYDVKIEIDLYRNNMSVWVGDEVIIDDEDINRITSIDSIIITYSSTEESNVYFENLFISSVVTKEADDLICNMLPMTNENDEDIYLVKKGNVITAKAQLINPTTNIFNATIILAAYKGDKLVAMNLDEATNITDTAMVKTTLDITGLDVSEVKAFVMDKDTLVQYSQQTIFID